MYYYIVYIILLAAFQSSTGTPTSLTSIDKLKDGALSDAELRYPLHFIVVLVFTEISYSFEL